LHTLPTELGIAEVPPELVPPVPAPPVALPPAPPAPPVVDVPPAPPPAPPAPPLVGVTSLLCARFVSSGASAVQPAARMTRKREAIRRMGCLDIVAVSVRK
jgi:hypothetical protein